MFKMVALTLGLSLPGLALACGGTQTADRTSGEITTAAVAPAADADPTGCAKTAALVGSNCAYSTGMMAQKVHVTGVQQSLTGVLSASSAKLDSHVAAPYTVDGMYVIANEIVDQISDPSKTLAMTGKSLEVDGVKYFLVTGFEATAS